MNHVKSLSTLAVSVFLGLFSFIFYHFLIFPLFLDYGIYGVLLVIGLLAILLWLIPKGQRLFWVSLAIGFLLVVRGMYRVEFKPYFEQLIAFLLLSSAFVGASKLIDRKKTIVYALTLSLLAGGLTAAWQQQELFFAKKFQVLYKSPKLYLDTNVEYFPLQLTDVTQDGKKEIITQGYVDHDYVLVGRDNMDLEASRYMVFQYDHGTFNEIGLTNDVEPLLWSKVVRDYVGFPFYTTEWINGEQFIHRYRERQRDLLSQGMLQMDYFHRLEDTFSGDSVDILGITPSFFGLLNRDSRQISDNLHTPVDNSLEFVNNFVGSDPIAGVYDIMVPLVDRLHLIQRFLPFGATPFEALSLSQENLEHQISSWDTVMNNIPIVPAKDPYIAELIEKGAVVVGEAFLTDVSRKSGVAELVLYRNGLEVYQQTDTGQWNLISSLTPDMLRQVADGEFLLADITKDGRDEILLSGTPSQVLALEENIENLDNPYVWKQLWVAQDDVFRFEAVNGNYEIIALSQSYKRNEGRRFLTGYEFVSVMQDGMTAYEMRPLWRVHQSVINVRVGDVTGDGQEEIVASYFRDHRFVVLREHNWPVEMLAWLLTLFVFASLGFYRYRNSRQTDDKPIEEGQLFSKQHPSKINVPMQLLVVAFGVILLSSSLTGCTHRSATGIPQVIGQEPIVSDVQSNKPFTDSEWQEYWKDVINYTNENGQRFWYSGWVATKVQKRRTTSMFDGIVIRNGGDDENEQQIMVNARLLGKPYAYYEAGDLRYMNENQQWKRLAYDGGYPVDWMEPYNTGVLGEPLRLDSPFDGLLNLVTNNSEGVYQYIQQPTKIGKERILGQWTDKIVFTVHLQDSPATTMEWTVWVGEDDPYLYQYEVVTLMPVPGAGKMQQKTFFRFWNYNDATIKMTDPLAIEKQIVQREKLQIENIILSLGKDEVRATLSEREIRLLELRQAILEKNVESSIYTQSLLSEE